MILVHDVACEPCCDGEVGFGIVELVLVGACS
jgi:hypothetical protein